MLLIGMTPVFIVAKYAVSISASTMPLTTAVVGICQDLPDPVLSRSAESDGWHGGSGTFVLSLLSMALEC